MFDTTHFPYYHERRREGGAGERELGREKDRCEKKMEHRETLRKILRGILRERYAEGQNRHHGMIKGG